MPRIKVVSFDREGTVVTPDFSLAVWYEGIPSLYAERNGVSIEQAKMQVWEEYEKVGSQRLEWYDIKHWFRYFGLDGYQELLAGFRDKVSYYSETLSVLSSLGEVYPLVLATGTSREFLLYLLSEIDGCFVRVFSSVSDYRQLKTSSFYLKVCQEMGVSPEEMAHVGDSWQFDFTMPREAGVNAFHLDRKGQPGSESMTDLRQFESKLLGL
jgi:putative hydrolase of the HAD superfamily